MRFGKRGSQSLEGPVAASVRHMETLITEVRHQSAFSEAATRPSWSACAPWHERRFHRVLLLRTLIQVTIIRSHTQITIMVT